MRLVQKSPKEKERKMEGLEIHGDPEAGSFLFSLVDVKMS